jgi:hypothetical protein
MGKPKGATSYRPSEDADDDCSPRGSAGIVENRVIELAIRTLARNELPISWGPHTGSPGRIGPSVAPQPGQN